MSDKSGIQWTEATWNPVTGCSKVSQGCKNCYALRDWPRLSAPRPKPNAYTGRAFTDVMCHPERLDQPLRWTKPRRVFVNSMSDLFHESVPFEFIAAVFSIMAVTTRHTYQVLTKRPERMRSFFDWVLDGRSANLFDADERVMRHWPQAIPWKAAGKNTGIGYDNCGPRFPYENVWLGVSVEDQATADERIPLLLQTPAAVRFVSYEPALGPVDFTDVPNTANFAEGQRHVDALRGYAWECSGPEYIDICSIGSRIDWVIVGGESGPKARPCDVAWIRSTVEQCKAAGVPCFVKQLGAIPVSDNMFDFPATWAPDMEEPLVMQLNDRKGGDMDEWREDLRVRQFPQ